MTAVDLICCPYDSGRRNWRCGLGPKRILQQGAVARIQSGGTDVRLVEIETQVSYETEISLVFEAQRQIAMSVAKARDSGRLPLVLGGNCNTAVGGAPAVSAGPGSASSGLMPMANFAHPRRPNQDFSTAWGWP